MKLNENCMKDILQYCADNIYVLASGMTTTQIKPLYIKDIFTQYDVQDVIYSLAQLVHLNYLITDYIPFDSVDRRLWDENTKVVDVTYAGHKYLESFTT